MDFIKEWVTNIILFILLATVIDMLLPNSKMQKYTKMVTGLLLIAVILTPILKFVGSNFEETLTTIGFTDQTEEKKIENSIEMKKREIQAWQHAYILEEMAVQFKLLAEEELIAEHGLKIIDLQISVDESNPQPFPDNVQNVYVLLAENDDQVIEAVDVIKRVDINTREALPSNAVKDAPKAIAAQLAQIWQVNEFIPKIQKY